MSGPNLHFETISELSSTKYLAGPLVGVHDQVDQFGCHAIVSGGDLESPSIMVFQALQQRQFQCVVPEGFSVGWTAWILQDTPGIPPYTKP